MIGLIDVSKYQGVCDFHKMVDNGVKGVLIRVANGDVFDPMFGINVPRAQAVGLEVGGYTFVNPKKASGAVAGSILAKAHNDFGCTLPPMLDIEGYLQETGNLPYITGAPFAAWIREMAAVTEAGSRKPFFYANASFWNTTVGDMTFGDHDCLVPRYPFYSPTACAQNVPPLDASKWGDWIMQATPSRPQVPAGWITWAGWQFSAGFNGRAAAYGASQGTNIDLNIIKPDVWARWTKAHTPDQPTPPPAPASVSQEDDDMPKYVTLQSSTGDRPDRVMAFDGSGHALLPASVNPDSVKAIRVVFGNGDLEADGTKAWATPLVVDDDTYDAFVATANGAYPSLIGEPLTSVASVFPDVVKVQVVGVGATQKEG